MTSLDFRGWPFLNPRPSCILFPKVGGAREVGGGHLFFWTLNGYGGSWVRLGVPGPSPARRPSGRTAPIG